MSELTTRDEMLESWFSETPIFCEENSFFWE